MGDPAGKTGTQSPASPEAYAPGGFALRVLCDRGHPLSGLFVVWSARPPAGGGKGGGSGGGSGSSGAPSPEQEIMKVADKHDPPRGRFAAGVVDEAGYLQPIFRDVNPWYDVTLDERPHTFKLEPNRKYAFVLLRHPSAKLARDLADALNEPGPAFDFAPWGGVASFGGEGATPASLVKERDLVTSPPKNVKAPPGDGKELYLVVPEASKPEDYWPKGHPIYNGWTLYLGMPGGDCRDVRKEVERLQKHLGILRFPIGIQERPYWPEPRTEKLKPGNLGIFELRTAAALVRFQEHAAEGRAFRLTPEAAREVHGRLLSDPKSPREPTSARYTAAETWACLLGSEVGPKRADGAEDEAVPGILPEIAPENILSGHALGVADSATGAALEFWLESGFRKPGKILLRVQGPPAGYVCLREEAAVQVEAWRRLGQIFGVSYDEVPYGMPSGHSFRDVSGIARAVSGVLNNSIHKTGLAIDFALKSTRNDTDFTRPAPYWPIRVEQRFDEPRRDPAALAKRQRKRAEDEGKALAAERAKDERALLENGGTPPGGGEPAARPTSLQQARSRSVLARGKANTARARGGRAVARQGNDPSRKAKTNELLARTIELDDAYRAALDAEIDLAEETIKSIEEEIAKTKSTYRMRWCLYGHSSLDVFGSGAPEALKTLQADLEALPRTLEEALASRFPSSLRAQAEEWIRQVAFQAYLSPRDVAGYLANLPPQQLVASYFRCAIRPFLFDPMAPDGGRSWEKALVAGPSVKCPKELKPLRPEERDLPCVADGAAPPAPLQPFEGKARSYVSLTGLGWLCDMFGIGTAGSKWKLGVAFFTVTKNFPLVASYVEAAAKHAEAKLEEVVVFRRKSVAGRLEPEKLEIPFMTGWAEALADLARAPGSGKKRKASSCFRVKGSRLVVRLAPPELAEDGDRLVPLLKGKLENARFVVLDPGKETGLEALAGAGALKGSKLGAELEAASKAFRERVEAHRKAAAEQAKAGKEKKGRQGRGRPSDLARRNRTWFEVTLQPLFETKVVPAADLGNVLFQPGDLIQVAAPGNPRTLEWWHYQSLAAKGEPWVEMVKEIGFSQRILLPDEVPPEKDGGDWDGRGIGYTRPELDSTAGGQVAIAPPANSWNPPPAGW